MNRIRCEQLMKAFCTGVSLALCAVIAAGCGSVRQEEARVLSDKSMLEKEVVLSEGQPEKLPELGPESTLNDYLVYAGLNNPGLKAAFLRWEAALEKIPQVTTLPDPQLAYMVFLQQGVMAPQRSGPGLNQTFPWFGKLQLKGNAAAEMARAEKARYDAAQLKLFYQVKDAYFEYYYLAQAIAVTQENLGYVRYLESVARAGYAAGILPNADVVRSEVEMGKLEDWLKTLNDQAEPIAARLNAALNRPPDAPLLWPGKLEEQKASFTQEQLLSWLKESNPDLKAIDFQAAGAKWDIDLAKKEYFPDITLGIQGFDTGRAFSNDPVMGTVAINLPIWWNKYRAEEREAAARYNSFLREHLDRENSLIANVEWVSYKYRDAERKIALYRDSLIPEAKLAFNVSIEGYQTGTATFFNVIDSIRVLLEFELSYERAFADREQRLAELEMLVGRPISREE